jgi:hypothetical protein
MYTCDFGECVLLANKCNSKIDCHDESDETDCQYLEVTRQMLHMAHHYPP